MVRTVTRVDNNMISEVEITSCTKIKEKNLFHQGLNKNFLGFINHKWLLWD